MTKNFEIIIIGFEKGVHLGSGITKIYLPMWCYKLEIFYHQQLLDGSFANENQIYANIGHVMSPKCHMLDKILPHFFFIIEHPQYKLVSTSQPHVTY